MTSSRSGRATVRRLPGIPVAGLLAAIAAIAATAAALASPSMSFPASTPAARADEVRDDPIQSVGQPAAVIPPRSEGHGSLGPADGALPGDATIFDDQLPGIANLDPSLVRALRLATAAAVRDGVEIVIESGWRSAAYQQELLREAVAKYGSAQAAARWVATPETSAHVSGNAVDIGPADAVAWMSQHGAAQGLCQIYRNEPWHFESRPRAIANGCPRMYADAAHDPRMDH